MAEPKEYKLEIDPRILELLGPSLYTNIYYVLAELIANAYDADAKNVYIAAHKDDVTVEDDGHGMSYDDGDIARYLNVGGATRESEAESRTRSGKRRRMGRKGVGKLAALSVSENVDIMTKAGNELSGFVLSRRPPHGNLLDPIPNKDIKFEHVKQHGSSVVMRNPEYRLHKSLDAVKRNLLKIFPLVSRDFKIHVFRDKEKIIIDSFDANVVKELAVLITLGDDFKSLSELVETDYPKRRNDLVKSQKTYTIPIAMQGKDGQKHEYTLEIKGWIGAYKTTRGRKAEITDFPDNFISLYANKKLGEFNILPSVGQNKLNEVYVVGQLHVDLFELTELPDMALSNRQGYKSDDPRYEAVLDYVRKTLLNDVLRLRDLFADIGNEAKKKKKLDEQRRMEAALRAEADKFRDKVADTTAKRLAKLTGIKQSKIQQVISEVINTNQPDIGLKQKVDSLKKRILISQTYGDKPFADIVYQMLLFNGVPADHILYTNCDDQLARIPEDESVYGYLREFFVDSYSTQKIFAVFVTSANTKQSWGAITEVGAAWITQIDNKIFNIHPFRPEHPLDDDKQWQSTNLDEKGDLWMTAVNADVFCQKIEAMCAKLGYAEKDRAANKKYLATLVSIRQKK
jgi:hypothetical protein